jgi:hypothetical protein
MFTAVALLVGVVIVWLLADQAYLWVRARQQSGENAWHGRGPGTTFRSTGFEDTIPPHEPGDMPRALGRRHL